LAAKDAIYFLIRNTKA
jgi:hypothetical protein